LDGDADIVKAEAPTYTLAEGMINRDY